MKSPVRRCLSVIYNHKDVTFRVGNVKWNNAHPWIIKHWWDYTAIQAMLWYEVAKMAPFMWLQRCKYPRGIGVTPHYQGAKFRMIFFCILFFLPPLKHCLNTLKTLYFFSEIHIFPQYLYAYSSIHLFSQSFWDKVYLASKSSSFCLSLPNSGITDDRTQHLFLNIIDTHMWH